MRNTTEVFGFKWWLNWLSIFVGTAIPCSFGWDIYAHAIPQNPATWLMVLALDVLGVALAISAGNKRPYMQMGWTLGAVCIVLAIFFGKAHWSWGVIESFSVLFGAIAVLYWQLCSVKFGIFFQTVAIYVSFIPQLVDFWYHPKPETWWLWVGSSLATIITIYCFPKKTFAYVFIPWSTVFINGVVLLFIFR